MSSRIAAAKILVGLTVLLWMCQSTTGQTPQPQDIEKVIAARTANGAAPAELIRLRGDAFAVAKRMGDGQRMAAHLRAILVLNTKVPKPDRLNDSAIAGLQLATGQRLGAIGSAAEGLPHLQDAARYYAAHSPAAFEYEIALFELAKCQLALNQVRDARVTFAKLRALGRANHTAQSPFYFLFHIVGADIEMSGGNIPAAEIHIASAVKRAPHAEKALETQIGFCENLLQAGHAATAHRWLEDIAETTNQQTLLSVSGVYFLMIRAEVEVELMQHTSARATFEQAVDLLEQVDSSPLTEIFAGRIWYGLGNVHEQLFHEPKALAAYTKSLEYRMRRAENSAVVAETLRAVASLSYRLGQREEAYTFAKLSAQVFEQAAQADPVALLGCYHRQAALMLMFDDTPKAIDALERGRRLLALVPAESRVAADWHSRAGQVYLKSGDLDKAIVATTRALEIDRLRLPPNHFYLSVSLSNLGRAHWRRGLDKDRVKAIQLFDESRRITKHHVTSQLPRLPPAQQMRFLSIEDRQQLAGFLSHALDAQEVRPSQMALEWTLNSKALAYEIRGLRERQLVSSDDPKSKQLRERRQELSHLQIFASPNAPDQTTQRMDKIQLEIEELETQLGAEVQLEATPWVTLESVRAALSAKTVLWEFVRFRPFDVGSESDRAWEEARYVAWVVPAAGNGNVETFDLGPAVAIDNYVAQFVTEMRDADDLFGKVKTTDDFERFQSTKSLVDAPLDKLGGLFAPLIMASKDSNVIVSPDGDSWAIPWAAIRHNGEYLLESRHLTTTLSGRMLVGGGNSSLVRGPPVFFVKPDYNLPPDPKGVAATGSRLSQSLRDLKYGDATDAMIRSAREICGHRPVVVDGRKATKPNFLAITNPEILVVSTHGDSLPGPANTERGYAALNDEPLARTYLACAGANHHPRATFQNNGFVTGLEVLNMNLAGTRLVVLSACNSGVGAVRNGEGVMAIRQAFQLAGAESTVETLWSVSDKHTAIFTEHLLGQLAQGMSRGEAIRKARFKVIEVLESSQVTGKYEAHPYYWAAFLLCGQP